MTGTTASPRNLIEARQYAIAMASRWGGEWVVLQQQDTEEVRIVGNGCRGASRDQKHGYAEIGRATSNGIAKIRWVDRNGNTSPVRVEPPPTQTPTPIDIDLADPEIDRLARLTWRILRIQNAFKHAPATARGLLCDPETAGALPVAYHPYLALVRDRGMISREIQRLENTLTAAEKSASVTGSSMP